MDAEQAKFLAETFDRICSRTEMRHHRQGARRGAGRATRTTSRTTSRGRRGSWRPTSLPRTSGSSTASSRASSTSTLRPPRRPKASSQTVNDVVDVLQEDVSGQAAQSCARSPTRSLTRTVDFFGMMQQPAAGFLRLAEQSQHPPPRPACRLPPGDGVEGAGHLRRQRRRADAGIAGDAHSCRSRISAPSSTSLRRDNDVVTVDAPVDPHLEVAEIHRRVIAAGGPGAALHQRRKAPISAWSTNLFGTARRAELAFGERPLRLIRRLVELAETLLPPTPSALWGARDVGLELLKVGMRNVPTGPVVERVTSDVRLDRLPALTCWPEDGGPFITLPLVYTTHPDKHGHNLGMYRMQVHDARTTGMHWQIGKGGGYHYAAGRSPWAGAAGHRVSRRATGADPVGDRTTARERPGTDAGVAHRRRAPAAGAGPRSPPAGGVGGVRADGRGAAAHASARGSVRRPLRLLLAPARLSGVRRAADRAPRRRDLSGDGGRQAEAGGFLHRRSPPGTALAALPAGDARGRAAVVVR